MESCVEHAACVFIFSISLFVYRVQLCVRLRFMRFICVALRILSKMIRSDLLPHKNIAFRFLHSLCTNTGCDLFISGVLCALPNVYFEKRKKAKLFTYFLLAVTIETVSSLYAEHSSSCIVEIIE